MQGGDGPLPLILAWLDSSTLKEDPGLWSFLLSLAPQTQGEGQGGGGGNTGLWCPGLSVGEAARESQVRGHWEVGLSVGGHLTERPSGGKSPPPSISRMPSPAPVVAQTRHGGMSCPRRGSPGTQLAEGGSAHLRDGKGRGRAPTEGPHPPPATPAPKVDPLPRPYREARPEQHAEAPWGEP